MDLSIVIPIFNERECLPLLCQRVVDVIDSMPNQQAEVVLVDDGSTDGSEEVLQAIQQDDSRIVVVRFRRNFGQTAAMRAGIQAAKGRLIVTMDGDLQNDPTDIPRMLAKIDEGYDLVVGWRKDRNDAWFSRKLPSKIANWLIQRITSVPIRDTGCSLKAYRATMIKQLPLYCDMHRFIPAMCAATGARITEMPVQHHAREYGESKYGLSRIGKVILDIIAIRMLMMFSHRPIKWFFGLSIPFWIFSTVALTFYITPWLLTGESPSLIVLPTAIVLFTYITVHLLFVGLLAELALKVRSENVAVPKGSVTYYGQW